MVAGLEVISKGTISIDGRVVNDVPPKERDIAMVFQNYALYPHMTVFDNMAFGLKLQKMPRERSASASTTRPHPRSRRAARRKPAALSGGSANGRDGAGHRAQPPGVPDGRAPVEPRRQAAVQMRSEIARIQNDLGVTTIYVTTTRPRR